jgi:RHS repeat-associated protein
MVMSWKQSWLWAVGLALASPAALAQTYRDALVQPPRSSFGEPGTVAGSFASLAYAPGSLSRGAIRVPSPIVVPSARGTLPEGILPSYAPERGASEWGTGWSASTAIVRHRDVGTLDYATDDFASPFGVLVPGTDGYYYSAGLASHVRARFQNGAWTAYLPDGERHVFAVREENVHGTYAWHLSEVIAANGERTELSYVRATDGRQYVQRVRWGGRGSARQYELALTYEAIATPLVSYRSRVATALDRRVVRVDVRAFDPSTATFAPRWHHDLAYVGSATGVAFHLRSVRRTFASGETEPAQTFTYGDPDAVLRDARLQPAPSLASYVDYAGQAGIQPDRVAFVDMEDDGELELEHGEELLLFRREAGVWEAEALPPLEGDEDPLCRPAPSGSNAPRLLVRMTPDAAEPHVVVARRQSSTTQITLCDRAGHVVHQERVSGAFELGVNTRLTDVDVDRRPDVVRVYRGGYQVLANESDGDTFRFVARGSGTLSPAFDPTATWVRDVNGDGLPDLVARSTSAHYVWYGEGNQRFVRDAQRFDFVLSNGNRVTDLRPFLLTFTDTNQDGLVDVVLGSGRWLYLFTNRGAAFRQTSVPAFREITTDVGLPVAVDLEGRGEEQIVVIEGMTPKAITLSRPETGLLVAADDGKGGRVELSYARAPATPGIVARPPLLVGMTVRATGEATLTHRYDYDAPVFHSVGGFLLGYELVRRVGTHEMDETTFHHDDDVQGLELVSRRFDARMPEIVRERVREAEESSFAGVRWFRPSAEEERFVSDGESALASRVEILAYDGLCASVRETTTPHGLERSRVTFARPAALAEHVGCLTERTVLEGRHASSDRVFLAESAGSAADFLAESAGSAADFDHVIAFERNAYGELETLRAGNVAGLVDVQRIARDADRRVTSVWTASEGTRSFVWDAASERLLSSTATDGVVTHYAYDGATDGVATVVEDRGVSWTRRFVHDGRERVAATWDDVGTGSAASPDRAWAYAFATNEIPGRIVESIRVQDAATREHAELFGADGQSLATAQRAPEGWVFGSATRRDRGELSEHRGWRAPFAGELGTLSEEALFAADAWVVLREIRRDAFERDLADSEVVQEGVLREATSRVAIERGRVVRHVTEAGVRVRSVEQDAAGRVVAIEDGAGARTTYEYDALGRLVAVELPDGLARRTVRYDAVGRIAEVHHPESGSVAFEYGPAGALARKRFVDTEGTTYREVIFERDAALRVTQETHVDPIREASHVFVRTWDGTLPSGATVGGQRGRLSGVRGPGFRKTYFHGPDGNLWYASIELDDWRRVVVENVWNDDGSLRSSVRRVETLDGTVLEQTRREIDVDAHGRVAGERVNGATLYTLRYDGMGRVLDATFADGTVVVPTYDAVTRATRGQTVATDDWTFDVLSELDAHGRVARERVEHATGVGTPTVHDVTYGYDARGFLTGAAETAGATWGYAYDANGLLASVTRDGAVEAIERGARTIARGDDVYTLDAAGRVIGRGDLALTYGPDGQLERATRPGHEATFVHDEEGLRLMRREHGRPVAAWVLGGYLDARGFVDTVRVDGRVVGFVADGRFEPVGADDRGTVRAEGGAHWPVSPYGERDAHPTVAERMDYASHAYDGGLGVVRMGVRDYDPQLGSFWTPDPLFSEELERCVQSPVECGLYGYAQNDPMRFVDPDGRQSVKVGKTRDRDGTTSDDTSIDVYSHKVTGIEIAPGVEVGTFKVTISMFGVSMEGTVASAEAGLGSTSGPASVKVGAKVGGASAGIGCTGDGCEAKVGVNAGSVGADVTVGPAAVGGEIGLKAELGVGVKNGKLKVRLPLVTVSVGLNLDWF